MEQRLIKERQQYENSFIFAEQRFAWNEKVDEDRFETMITELLKYQSDYRFVRKVGSTREGDGGRDIQAEKIFEKDGKPVVAKILIQCKAYSKTVGKGDVRDIRDTLDRFNANGYVLVVSSRISVPLQDYLENLKDKHGYYIEWLNKEDIEILLRKSPEVLMRYTDIVKVIDENE